MRVAVGSTNPTKVEGVKRAFEIFFKDVCVIPKSVKSGVRSQPIDDEVVEGAINRALNSYGNCDFSVGVEAGLFRIKGAKTGYIDFQVAVIYDGKDYSIGFGPGFEFPPFVVDRALKGYEVGKIMSKITGIKDIGRRFGAIYYLTKGAVSRVDLTKIAVIMALIPWLNLDLYR